MANRVRHQCGRFMRWDDWQGEWYCAPCERAFRLLTAAGPKNPVLTTARTEPCRDQVGSCICTGIAGHMHPHRCTPECGATWGDNGVPLSFPDHGPHCSASCHSQGYTDG